MTFAELLAAQPHSNYADWTTAAKKQLRNRTIQEISVKIAGRSLAPYTVATSNTGPPSGDHKFKVVADLRGPSAAHFRSVLEWGAQALFLDDTVLHEPPSSLEGVRFDFLTVYAEAKASSIWSQIPAAQQGQCEFYSPFRQQDLSSSERVLIFFQEAELSDRNLAAWVANTLLPAMQNRDFSGAASLAISVRLPADYLECLVLIQSLRLLHANACLAVGQYEPITPAHWLGHVDARAGAHGAEAWLIDSACRSVAGATAGLDAIMVTPFDHSVEQCRRALNIGHVLAIEAGFGLAHDALSGATWVAEAASLLAKSAWEAVCAT